MNARQHDFPSGERATGNLLRAVVLSAWGLVRLLIVAVFVLIEPIVRTIVVILVLTGVAAAVVIEASGARPDFPVWDVLGVCAAGVLIVPALHALIRWLTR